MKKVVYDVDNTLWNLTETVFEELGIPLSDCISYIADENQLLTEEQKKQISCLYANEKIFAKCRFYDGYQRIFDLEKDGLAEIWISSANLNEEVLKVKKRRLLDEVPNINKDHMALTVKNVAQQGREPGDILIDDCIFNIATSDFEYNILIDMPYNQEIDSMAIQYPSLKDKRLIRAKSLNDAITIVETIVKKV